MKECTGCKVVKSLLEFSKHRGTKDGLCHICRECSRTRSKAFRDTPSGMYTLIKGRVKFINKYKNYHSLNMTREEFVEWYNSQEKNCIYCGLSEENLQNVPDGFNNNSKRLTIDCKDAKRGYSLDNIVLACWRCNILKGNILTFDEMMYVGQNFIKSKWESALDER